ncbi:MAG: hypothetical protein JXR96_04900 [Deltaproteobacteria bacterium]|nr:hypothetical protein [Deltaproteobacteria bacterium]
MAARREPDPPLRGQALMDEVDEVIRVVEAGRKRWAERVASMKANGRCIAQAGSVSIYFCTGGRLLLCDNGECCETKDGASARDWFLRRNKGDLSSDASSALKQAHACAWGRRNDYYTDPPPAPKAAQPAPDPSRRRQAAPDPAEGS